MIKPDLSKWEYSKELEGLLIFSQALDEMLFYHTIDTYKAPALNVRTNILELRYLVSQLQDNKIRLGTIEPVIQELENRLKDDVVIHNNYNNLFSYYFGRINELKAKPQDLISVIDALLSEINNFYWAGLLSTIEEKVKLSQRKHDIISLAMTFITEAEFQGFSRSFIHYKNQGFFFKSEVSPKKITSPEQIKDFLSFFVQEPPNWHVLMKVSGEYSKLKEYAAYQSNENVELIILDDLSNDLQAELRGGKRFLLDKKPDFPLFLSVKISKGMSIREPSSARDFAREAVGILADVYSFVVHQEQPLIYDESLVFNGVTGDASILTSAPNPMKCGIQKKIGGEEKPIVQLFIDIINSQHFHIPSTRLIIKSLDFHRAALEAQTPENQLLDLWAALEGFLPPPPEDGARVKHYITTLIPSLTLTYPEKIFRYLADSIYHGGGKCRNIVESINIDGDFFMKTVCLVTCADLEETRKQLYGELENHLLLRNRIYEVHEMFKSKSAIKKTLEAHKQRITWHIQRIYTTRNQIVHNADSLPYLRTLVENLHSYFDILIETVSVVGINSKNRLSISAALSVLNVHERNYIKSLEGESVDCVVGNCIDLIFGSENIIAPHHSGISFY